MKMTKHLHGIMLGAALTLFAGATVAQDRPRDDRRRPEDQNQRANDRDRHDDRDHHNEGRAEYHFRARKIVSTSARITRKTSRQWRQHPDRRHQFRAGERLPSRSALEIGTLFVSGLYRRRLRAIGWATTTAMWWLTIPRRRLWRMS